MRLRFVIERGFDPPHSFDRQPFYLATVNREGEYDGDLRSGGTGFASIEDAKRCVAESHPDLKWRTPKNDPDSLLVSGWYEDEGWDNRD